MSNQHKDITGQIFGRLKVIGMVKKGFLYHALCECTCGTVKTFIPANLRTITGSPKSCGCQPRARKPTLNDLVGRQFGFLQVLSMEQVGKTSSGAKSGTYYAICRCTNCGIERHPVLPASLRRGATTSCGCRHDQYLCNTGKNNPRFKGYEEIRSHFWRGYMRGALDRGIPFDLSIEYAWRLFEEQGRCCALSGVPLLFGVSSKNSNTTASIDRIDNSKGYVEGNIQWVHKRVNTMRNTLPVDAFIDWCKKIANHADQVSDRGRNISADPRPTPDHARL